MGRLASRSSHWGHAVFGHEPSLAPFHSPTVVQVAAIAGRARDRANRRRAIDPLTSADAATAVGPDRGEVAGSIPASPTLLTRAKPVSRADGSTTGGGLDVLARAADGSFRTGYRTSKGPAGDAGARG